MKVGSLFSGIGGLDLGLERAGMEVVWQCEIDPWCCRVLAKHWPDVPNLGDATEVDWKDVERVELICGGYPCQPFSHAGARRGDDDERHLWPFFADAIRHLRPRFALLENVPGHLSLGFGRVLGDLAEIGYDAEWDCIPAAAVGAPHRRDRIFVVAHPNGEGEPVITVDGRPRPRLMVPDTGGEGLEGRGPRGSAGDCGGAGSVADAEIFTERPRLCPRCQGGVRRGRSGDGGCEGHTWALEPDVGRVAHGVPARVDRLRSLGNAVVPQVAEWIGQRIMEVAA